MSVRIMNLVWQLKLPRDEKLVLLAYADHADDSGGSIHPSVGRLAEKTGYKPRAVQLITRKLERGGLLRDAGRRPVGTRCWVIPPEALGSARQEAGCAPGMQGDAPGGCTGMHPGDAPECTGGAHGDAPESSLESSLRPSEEQLPGPPPQARPPVVVAVKPGEAEILEAYRREIGRLTPGIHEAVAAWLDAGQVPRAWLTEAIRQAALSNVRRWSYVEGILQNWQRSGKPTRRRNRHGSHSKKDQSPAESLGPEQEAADILAAEAINELSRLRRHRLEVGKAG